MYIISEMYIIVHMYSLSDACRTLELHFHITSYQFRQVGYYWQKLQSKNYNNITYNKHKTIINYICYQFCENFLFIELNMITERNILTLNKSRWKIYCIFDSLPIKQNLLHIYHNTLIYFDYLFIILEPIIL